MRVGRPRKDLLFLVVSTFLWSLRLDALPCVSLYLRFRPQSTSGCFSGARTFLDDQRHLAKATCGWGERGNGGHHSARTVARLVDMDGSEDDLAVPRSPMYNVRDKSSRGATKERALVLGYRNPKLGNTSFNSYEGPRSLSSVRQGSAGGQLGRGSKLRAAKSYLTWPSDTILISS